MRAHISLHIFHFNFYIMLEEKCKRRSKVPAFVVRILDILEDPSEQEVICWLPDGQGFQIINKARFTEQVLPKYFKHKNLASFIRQLNIYEFSRIKTEKNIAYFHQCFKKNEQHLLKKIKRKKIEYEKVQNRMDAEKKSFRSSELRVMHQNIQKREKSCLRMMKENEQLKKEIQNIQEEINNNRQGRTKLKKPIENFHSTSEKKLQNTELNKWRTTSSFNLIQRHRQNQFFNLSCLITNEKEEINRNIVNQWKGKNSNSSDKTSDA